MILNLPDIRQEHDWSCGDAAVRTVMKFFGRRQPVSPLATREHGTHPAQIQQALILAGLRTFSGSLQVAHLKSLTNAWTPVICAVRDDEGNGHWVVCKGVQYGKVHFQCPSDGPKSRREQEWVDGWHDVGMFADKFDDFGIAVWER